MAVDDNLRTAIEGVYAAFADVRKPTAIPGCRCPVCLQEEDIKILLTKKLRELTPVDLTKYSESVFLTVGSVDDYFYFFPRILETSVTIDHWWPSPEVVARGMCDAGFSNWTSERQTAALNCFTTVFSEKMKPDSSADESGDEIDSWVCALGSLPKDVTPFLKILEVHPNRLREFYERNSKRLLDGRLSNSFWENASVAEKQIVEWFKSPEIQDKIQEIYGIREQKDESF
jgi:hypothetical protein